MLDSKDYLFKVMKGGTDTPSRTGKGFRKRIVNSKYLDDESSDEPNKSDDGDKV